MLNAATLYIKNRFGSKAGMINAVKYKLLYCSGVYSKYRNINFTKVKRLVFICSGNICRSPFAEFAARVYGMPAQSYGLDCTNGHPADPRAIACAVDHGFGIDGHSTKNISEYKAQEGDLIVVMEPDHASRMMPHLHGNAQITIATLWHNRPMPYLHDPYNSNGEYFGRCERILKESVHGLSKYVHKYS